PVPGTAFQVAGRSPGAAPDCTRSRSVPLTRNRPQEWLAIRGRAVDAGTGAALGGVSVWQHAPSLQVEVAVSDADGSFALDVQVPQGVADDWELVLLAALDRGHLGALSHGDPFAHHFALDRLRAGEPIELPVATHLPFAGRVVDAWSGAPIADLHVRLVGSRGEDSVVRLAARTDSTGRFEFEPAPRVGTYQLDVTDEAPEADGGRRPANYRLRDNAAFWPFGGCCTSSRARALSGGAFTRTATVQHRARASAPELVLEASPSLRIVPEVPLPDAERVHVAVWTRSGDGVARLEHTERSGPLRATGFELFAPSGDPWCLTVSAPGLWLASTGWRDTPRQGRHDVPFDVAEIGTLVLRPDAATVAATREFGLAVRLRPLEEGSARSIDAAEMLRADFRERTAPRRAGERFPYRSATVNEGRVEAAPAPFVLVPDVPAGRYELEVGSPGFCVLRREIAVLAGCDNGVELALVPDPDAGPVAGVLHAALCPHCRAFPALAVEHLGVDGGQHLELRIGEGLRGLAPSADLAFAT
ncbi:MAG TPA: carboxypeptidase-like regulatory domain-containing protein, partial [Planctomycetota bacterium]|nr:carboxypeptidase-like regulatory domain-containing protein [Planctomycetota bacterium]